MIEMATNVEIRACKRWIRSGEMVTMEMLRSQSLSASAPEVTTRPLKWHREEMESLRPITPTDRREGAVVKKKTRKLWNQ